MTDFEWEIIRTVYDAALAHTDHCIGRIVDYIDAHLNDSIIIILGDHGKYLGERNLLTHWLHKDAAVSHVPLIIKGATSMLDYEGPIQPIDVHRTLLEELNISHEMLQGIDLRHNEREWSIIQRGE
jgi:arylsulfatase A-like enzyme